MMNVQAGGYVMIDSASLDELNHGASKIVFYWYPDARHGWRFRIALALAKLAYWVGTR